MVSKIVKCMSHEQCGASSLGDKYECSSLGVLQVYWYWVLKIKCMLGYWLKELERVQREWLSISSVVLEEEGDVWIKYLQ